MSIQPGATAPTPLKSGCGNVCHTASADGSTLVANVQLGFESASYDLTNNAAVIQRPSNESFTYGGIYPDGSFVDVRDGATAPALRHARLAPLRHQDRARPSPPPAGTASSPDGGTPAFSPDGKQLAFNARGHGRRARRSR